MPYLVEVDSDAVLLRLQKMIWKIQHFKTIDIGSELSDWQTQDMHRHRPFTMRSRRAGRAATVVRPHSLYETRASVKYQSGLERKAASKAKRARSKRNLRALALWQRKTSTRPILREELGQKLVARMARLLQEKIRW
jgi:hypothetical protein